MFVTIDGLPISLDRLNLTTKTIN